MKSRRNRGSPPRTAGATLSPLSSGPLSSGGQRRVVTMELLGRGAHTSPRHGCCVLEYASVLAGERWSSRPESVHPALAEVADVVNDQMTDGRRRLLTPVTPWLLGTDAADPRIWPAVTEVCLRAPLALSGGSDEPALLASLDATRNWLEQASRPAAGPRRAHWPGAERRWARHAIRSALLRLAALAGRDDCDAALCQVLVESVNACRLLAGEPAVDPRLALADCPQHLAVEPHLVRSPGCDWTELGYQPARPYPFLATPARGPGSAVTRKLSRPR